jgi:hypothetical protein
MVSGRALPKDAVEPEIVSAFAAPLARAPGVVPTDRNSATAENSSRRRPRLRVWPSMSSVKDPAGVQAKRAGFQVQGPTW